MNSIDGFNERNFYIRKSNDINRLKSKGPSKFDNSLAKMNSERRGLVTTADSSAIIKPIEDTKGIRENFVVQNSHLNDLNRKNNLMHNNVLKRPN